MEKCNLSPVYCAHNGVLILEQSEKSIVIGMLDTENLELKSHIEARLLQMLRQSTGRHIPPADISKYITYRTITKDFFIRETSKDLVLYQEKDIFESKKNEGVEKDTNDIAFIDQAPIVYLLNSLLLECVEKNGSDIHIEPSFNGSRIRMRILGELEHYTVVDIDTSESLVLRVIFLAGLDISERRRSQDGSFHFIAGTISIEVRVSVIPSQLGLSCVLRILTTKKFERSFSGLGFSPCHINFLNDACEKNNSLVLICGATGAGKSTTLAAMLSKLAGEKKKLLQLKIL